MSDDRPEPALAAKILTRRGFLRDTAALSVGGLMPSLPALAAGEPTLQASSRMLAKGGPMVALQMSPEPTEADLPFARQMGVEYVVLWTGGANANYDYFASRRELFEKAGLKIYGFGNSSVHCQAALVPRRWRQPLTIDIRSRQRRARAQRGSPSRDLSNGSSRPAVGLARDEQARGR